MSKQKVTLTKGEFYQAKKVGDIFPAHRPLLGLKLEGHEKTSFPVCFVVHEGTAYLVRKRHMPSVFLSNGSFVSFVTQIKPEGSHRWASNISPM